MSNERLIHKVSQFTVANQEGGIVLDGNGNPYTVSNPIPTSESRADVEGGGKVAVGTTAVEVTFTGTTTSIIITADKDNSGLLYVGKSDVASDGSNALTFLQAGESLTIELDDSSSAIYVVSDTAAQNFWKGAIL